MAYCRLPGVGVITSWDIKYWQNSRRLLTRLAKAIDKYDKDWHGAMWDGQVIDEREVKAWNKIIKMTKTKVQDE